MEHKLFLESDLQEIKNGYTVNLDNGTYKCLICGKQFEDGEIYPFKGRLFEAKKAVAIHVKESHGSILDILLKFDKKYTGITDNQKSLLKDFYNGFTDKLIAKNNEVAEATVRHQRFMFREKAKQAKAYLAIFELVEEALNKEPEEDFASIHNGATMIDERYEVTNSEETQIINTYFDTINPLKLKSFPSKEKRKIVVLRKILTLFERDTKYTEKGVNEILKPVYADFATIRRYLIEYGFMERTKDCSEYHLK